MWHRPRRPSVRRLLVALAAGALLAPLVGPGAAQATTVRGVRYLLVPSAPSAHDVYPEGIATEGTTFYVSSTTDGTIYRGSIDDDQVRPWLPPGQDGRTTAVGLARGEGRLVVAGGGTGRAFVYSTRDGSLLASYDNGLAAAGTFVNDAAVAPDGSTYLTDSVQPYLYRIPPGATTDGAAPLERFLDFTGTSFVYGPGFNANGIVITPDGRYAIVVQSSTGDALQGRPPDQGGPRGHGARGGPH